MVGLFLAAITALNSGVIRDDLEEPISLLTLIAIAAVIGFSLSKIMTYAYALPNEDHDRIASRLLGFYQGMYFGSFMALTSEADKDWGAFWIANILSGGGVGLAMHFLQRRRRADIPRTGNAIDFDAPVDLDSPAGQYIRYYPIAVVCAVGVGALLTQSTYAAVLISALVLIGVRPVVGVRHFGVWRLVGLGFVSLCTGIAIFTMW